MLNSPPLSSASENPQNYSADLSALAQLSSPLSTTSFLRFDTSLQVFLFSAFSIKKEIPVSSAARSLWAFAHVRVRCLPGAPCAAGKRHPPAVSSQFPQVGAPVVFAAAVSRVRRLSWRQLLLGRSLAGHLLDSLCCSLCHYTKSCHNLYHRSKLEPVSRSFGPRLSSCYQRCVRTQLAGELLRLCPAPLCPRLQVLLLWSTATLSSLFLGLTFTFRSVCRAAPVRCL